MGRHHTSAHRVQPYACDSQEILDRLKASGLTPEFLARDRRVILWSLRVKGAAVKFKLHPLAMVDEATLKTEFQQAIGPTFEIILKLKPLSSCCQSACEGCLYGNPEKRMEWVEGAQ